MKLWVNLIKVVMLPALLVPGIPLPARANPTDGTVSAGSATIIDAGKTTTINQTTNKAVIDWRGFDISADEITKFNQPNSGSMTLNRVGSGVASKIDGKLQANGNVLIINPNGVIFGAGSAVDVNGLVASSADIDNDKFMNGTGKLSFDKPGNPNAVIKNAGTITARDAGLVGLVAPKVENSGTINVKLGRAALASGDTATVDFYGDGLLEVKASDALNDQVVKNTGTINADGGTVQMTAAAGRTVVNSLIQVDGTVNARAVGTQNGRIIIGAEGSHAVTGNDAALKDKKTGLSTVLVGGTLDATSASGKGGDVTITGDQVAVMTGGKVDASGKTGGGTIHVGGEYLGKGATPTSIYTVLQTGALLAANATGDGKGGEVILYSDGHTAFSGTIEAKGAGSGKGGFVETSGKQTLDALGTVDFGLLGGGTWLLDPNDITIVAGTTNSNISGSGSSGSPFVATGTTGSQVGAGNINTLLQGGNSVVIQTSNDGGSGNGDITVNAAITGTGGAAGGGLTLSAYRDITINGAITLNNGALTLQSNNANTGGGVYIYSNVATNGGNITIGGGSGTITAGSGYAVGRGDTADHQMGVVIYQAAVNAGSGAIIVNGQGSTSATNMNVGVSVYGNSGNVGTLTASGNVTVYGIGGGSGTSDANFGVLIGGTNSAGTGTNGYGNINTTGAGNLLINGTGGGGSGGGSDGIEGGSSNTGALGSGNATATGLGGSVGGGYGLNLTFKSNTGTLTINGSGGVNGYPLGVRGNYSTGGGDMIVNGMAGGGVPGVFGYSIFNAGTGNITITGISSNAGIDLNGDSIIGKNVTLITDSFSQFGGTITASGVLTVRNRSVGTAISLSGTDTTSSNTVLKISDSMMTNWTAASFVFGSTTSGDVAINTAKNFGTKAVTIISGNDINVTGLTNAGSGALALQAVRDITVNGAMSLAGGALTLQSRYTNGTGGVYIYNSIATNGGNIVIGGGSGTVMEDSGYAIGRGDTADHQNGVFIKSAALNAGGGVVIVNGQGSASTSNSNGGVVFNLGSLTTSGNMTVYGIGGGTGSSGNSFGISMINGTEYVRTSGTGNLLLNGTGGAGTGGGNTGLSLRSDRNGATGTGSVTLVGQGGYNGMGIDALYGGGTQTQGGQLNITAIGNNNVGMYGNFYSNGGDITVNASSNSGLGVYYLTYINAGTGNVSVTATNATGGDIDIGTIIARDVTINADTFANSNYASTITASGVLTVKTRTAGRTITLSGANTASDNSTLKISDTNMTNWTAASFVFGSTVSGDVAVNTARNFGTSGVTITSGNDINVAGFTNAGSGALTLQAVRDITVNGAMSLAGGALTLQSRYTNGTGGVYIYGNIATNGGNIAIGGGSGAIAAGNGYAIGRGDTTAHQAGVVINNVTVNSGAGNIVINGQGSASTAAGNHGVYYTGVNGISTSAGATTVYGIGGGSGASDSNYGVYVEFQGYGARGIYTTGAGELKIVGTSTSGSGGSNIGIMNAGTIQGAAAVTLIGITDGYNNGMGTQIGSYGVASTGSGLLTVSGSTLGAGIGLGIYSGITANGSGAIAVTGNGGTSGTGILTINNSAVASHGGQITVNATCGTVSCAYRSAANLGTIVSNNGDIVINALASGANSSGLNFTNINSGTGSIVINAAGISYAIGVDNGGTLVGNNVAFHLDGAINYSGSAAITATNTLTIDSYTAGRTIGIGTTSGSDVNISNAVLANMSAASFVFGNTTSGDMALNSTNNFGAGNVKVISGNDINVAGLTNAGSGAMTLQAVRDITVNGAMSLAGGALTMQSRYTNGTGGVYIYGNISTNGGNLTIGGGSGAIAAGNGYAIGRGDTTDHRIGVLISTATVNAGGGAITINGQGANTTDNGNSGVVVAAPSGDANLTSSGNITIYGLGGGTGGSAGNGGVVTSNTTSNARIYTSGAGSLIIIGTGGGNSTSFYNSGIGLNSASNGAYGSGSVTLIGMGGSPYSTGISANFGGAVHAETGQLTLTGTGNVFEGVSGYFTTNGGNIVVNATSTEIAFRSDYINAGTGNVTINATGGTGDVRFANGTIIGNNITVTADDFDDMTAGGTVTASGALTIKTRTAGQAITLSGGDTAADLTLAKISDAMMANWTAGSFLFGSATSGDITINTAHDFGGANMTFQSGRDILLAGNLTKSSGGNALYSFHASRNLSNASGMGIASSAGALELILNADADNNGSGTLTLNGGTFATNGGNTTVADALTLGGNTTFSNGAGTLSFIGAVDGAYNLTADAGDYSFGGALGGATRLGAVTLTSANSLTAPASIRAASIMLGTTGAAADLTLDSGTVLDANGGGNAITLSTLHNFINNAGSNVLNLNGSGRWLVYAADMAGNTRGGLVPDASDFGKTYAANAPGTIGAGNRFVYSAASGSVITLSRGNDSVTYGDAYTGAGLGGVNYISGLLAGDSWGTNGSGIGLSGSAGYTTAYVQGTTGAGSTTVTGTAGSLLSALGYSFAFTDGTLTVDKRVLTIGLTGSVQKVYDGNAVAMLSASNYTLGNRYGSDDVTITNTTGSYNDKNAASGKTVTVSGLTLGGTAAGNYQIITTSASGAVGQVTQKALTITGLSGVGRVYDGTTVAGLSGTAALNGTIGGDSIGLGGTGSGSFANKNVGTNKAITVSGYSLTGMDAGNYSLTQPTGLTATVTQKALTITAANQTIAYGATVPGGSVTYQGFVGGDTAGVLTSGAVVASAQTGTPAAGSYLGNYTVSGAAAQNYAISYVAGDLTVTGGGVTPPPPPPPPPVQPVTSLPDSVAKVIQVPVTQPVGTVDTYAGTSSSPASGTQAPNGIWNGEAPAVPGADFTGLDLQISPALKEQLKPPAKKPSLLIRTSY